MTVQPLFAERRLDSFAAPPERDSGYLGGGRDTVLISGAITFDAIGAQGAALMMMQQTHSSDPALARLPDLLPKLEALYTDVHAHPELSMQETRTAELASERLRTAGYEVTTAIGKTGVVGLLRNGAGPTVMLRADMDALPVEEATELPYASRIMATDRDGKTVPVMHALRPRYACRLARRRDNAAPASLRHMAGNLDGGVPTGAGDGGRRPGDDR